jgi:hypothetical protein
MDRDYFRSLLDHLHSIDLGEAPGDDPAADQGSFTPSASPQVAAATPAAGQIPVIDAPSFKTAYAKAKKQGLKVFKWCGTYKVQDAPRAQASGQPAGQPAPQRRQFDPSVGVPGRGTGDLQAPFSGSDLPISA